MPPCLHSTVLRPLVSKEHVQKGGHAEVAPRKYMMSKQKSVEVCNRILEQKKIIFNPKLQLTCITITTSKMIKTKVFTLNN